MTIEQYQTAVMACAFAARLVADHDLPAILGAMDRAETLAPVLDPTLYLRKSRAMEEDRKIIEAAMPLWRLGQKLRGVVLPSATVAK